MPILWIEVFAEDFITVCAVSLPSSEQEQREHAQQRTELSIRTMLIFIYDHICFEQFTELDPELERTGQPLVVEQVLQLGHVDHLEWGSDLALNILALLLQILATECSISNTIKNKLVCKPRYNWINRSQWAVIIKMLANSLFKWFSWLTDQMLKNWGRSSNFPS